MILKEYFNTNHKRKAMYKCLHYFDLYENHLQKFRGKKTKVLEIGIAQGGSLDMWQYYFGDQAEIIGLDCNKWCADVTDKKSYIGNQADRKFLRSVIKKEKSFDVIIDDGGHKSEQIVTSFQEFFPVLNDGGVYIVEDVCCAYWNKYQGGLKRKGTIIEISKDLIDLVNKVSDDNVYTESLTGIHFYNSMIIFDKGLKQKIETKLIGEKWLYRQLHNGQ